nr:PAS domain S-box protein [Fundidesulfovibrio agrisoli]
MNQTKRIATSLAGCIARLTYHDTTTKSRGFLIPHPLLLAIPRVSGHIHLVNASNSCSPADASRYQVILDAAVDAVIIIGSDRLIKAFSRAAQLLFGYDPEEVIGRNVNMLMPEPYAARHDGYVGRYLATREPHIIGVGREVRARRKDGSIFPAYLSVGEGLAEAETFFVGILHDLTREKETFRRVQQLASIVDSTGDAVTGHTLDGIVTYWNKGAEELYGYTAAEAVGRNLGDLIVPAEMLGELLANTERISHGDSFTRIESIRQNKAGQRLIISLSTSPIRDAEGNVIGAASIARDITARRLAEKAQAEARQAAEEANRIKSDFLSIVSHELRTPLTIILGNISLLTDHQNMPEPAEAALIAQDIEDSANRLQHMINDLLDISDMEAGQAHLRLTPVQAADLIDEVADAARPRVIEKGLRLETYTEEVEVLADPLRLKQALLNVVDNAVKFSSAGVITLGVSRTENKVLFEVSDHGSGMTEQELPRVFDAFHQGDTSSTRAAQGTGLGLTIVKRIVQLHQGTISVESEPGAGTTFYIALPLLSGEGSHEAAPDNE